jgi:hypothetical protein
MKQLFAILLAATFAGMSYTAVAQDKMEKSQKMEKKMDKKSAKKPMAKKAPKKKAAKKSEMEKK